MFNYPNSGRFTSSNLTPGNGESVVANSAFFGDSGLDNALEGNCSITINTSGEVIETPNFSASSSLDFDISANLTTTELEGSCNLSFNVEYFSRIQNINLEFGAYGELSQAELNGSVNIGLSANQNIEISFGQVLEDSIDIAITINSELLVFPARLHQVFYSTTNLRLHQVSYALGELQQRLHSVAWTSEARKLHSVFYEGLDATSIASASRLHEVLYAVIGADSTTSDSRLHEVFYSVIGADSIISASRLHEVFYDGTGISPVVLDQRLHEVFYSAIGADSISSASRLHEVLYAVIGADSITFASRLHEVSYSVIGVDSISSVSLLHKVLYEFGVTTTVTSDSRLHEILYSVIGADLISSASHLHEVLYTAIDADSITSDSHLHEVSYSVIGVDAVSSASRLHQIYYATVANIYNLHEVFYKVFVLDQRLHSTGWKADTEQRRLHEVRYHVTDISAIIEAGLITIGDGGLNAYDFLDITITADEESPYWQCEMTLKDSRDYVRFPRDTPFVVRLLDVDYQFIVDSRTLRRIIDDQGNYQELCTISGLSPLVSKARPRADKLTKTWEAPILASAVVAELIGSVTWNLVDWLLPAYRLAAENAAPLDIAKQVVEAVGGLIESQPDGSVVCRHRWPISIAQLDNFAPDHDLDETHIYAASESPTQDELIDRVRIYDSEPAFQDRLEYVPNKLGELVDPRNGILYAFISPWRDGLRIVTTRPSVISIGSSSVGTRTIDDGNEDYPAEVITFTERNSSTQYPIMNLTSLDWLDEDLGAAIFTPFSTTLEAGGGSYGGYSLAKVQYTARYLSVPVICTETVDEIEAQFLLLENQDG